MVGLALTVLNEAFKINKKSMNEMQGLRSDKPLSFTKTMMVPTTEKLFTVA